MSRTVEVFLCGDVMLGRGIDQIMAHPGDPVLREQHVRDARTYVELAEAVNGPVPRPVDPDWPWGDALALLAAAVPDVRLVNLETSVTTSPDFAPGKEVHYRMAPANLACLAAARPDLCVLANNHVLDFGTTGLRETLEVLAAADLRTAGAGRDPAEAWRPAAVPLPGGGRLVVLAIALPSSGVPPGWAASADRPGIAVVPALTDRAADAVTARLAAATGPDDVAAISVHWGSNWGWAVEPAQMRFARRLVDGGVALVHGHSSHHPRPVEVYRDRLVLYGCGDFVNDYEGIGGHEQYRSDLRLAYLATLEVPGGALRGLRMLVLRSRRLRLERAGRADVEWLGRTLDRAGRRLGSRIRPGADGTLILCRPGL